MSWYLLLAPYEGVGHFWSVKYLNFGPKLPIRTAHHTFLQSRHPEVAKNQFYVLLANEIAR